MFHIFCGCPFLSLLFLFAIGWALFKEHNKLKRHSVPKPLYWRIMLFAGTYHPHSANQWNLGVTFFLAAGHNRLLKSVFKRYEQTALERSFNSIWSR